MDDDKDNVHKLWHERLEESKITEYANDLVKRFVSMGVKVHTINVFWDDKGRFITETRGAHIMRRISDKKTPPNS